MFALNLTNLYCSNLLRSKVKTFVSVIVTIQYTASLSADRQLACVQLIGIVAVAASSGALCSTVPWSLKSGKASGGGGEIAHVRQEEAECQRKCYTVSRGGGG